VYGGCRHADLLDKRDAARVNSVQRALVSLERRALVARLSRFGGDICRWRRLRFYR
jgi:hypothetical protein